MFEEAKGNSLRYLVNAEGHEAAISRPLKVHVCFIFFIPLICGIRIYKIVEYNNASGGNTTRNINTMLYRKYMHFNGLGYADDMALLAPSMDALPQLTKRRQASVYPHDILYDSHISVTGKSYEEL